MVTIGIPSLKLVTRCFPTLIHHRVPSTHCTHHGQFLKVPVFQCSPICSVHRPLNPELGSTREQTDIAVHVFCGCHGVRGFQSLALFTAGVSLMESGEKKSSKNLQCTKPLKDKFGIQVHDVSKVNT